MKILNKMCSEIFKIPLFWFSSCFDFYFDRGIFFFFFNATFYVDNSGDGRTSSLKHSIFSKNFVKVTVLLNRLLKSWFDEILFWWKLQTFHFFTHKHTVWILRKFTPLTLFWQKFRESIAFTKYITTKELIWRKKVLMRVNLSFFHSDVCHIVEITENYSHVKFFRQTIFVNFLLNLLRKMKLFYTMYESSLIT